MVDRSRGGQDYWAHSENGGEHVPGVCEPLLDHLSSVADRSAQFAAPFSAAGQAELAGWFHDLGKYAEKFQQRLRDKKTRAGDHWSAGACYLAATYQRYGIAPALAILGHHAGLPKMPFSPKENVSNSQQLVIDLSRELKANSDAFTHPDPAVLLERFCSEIDPPSVDLKSSLKYYDRRAAEMFDIRMLFSALVDADFLETEAHFQGDANEHRRYRQEGPTLDIDAAIVALGRYVDAVRQKQASEPISSTREQLFNQCVEQAAQPTGLFSLSAPTGSGKTLAMLAFALHHAKKHGLRRVVLVMPFLNIIDQTAGIYRKIFSTEEGFDENTVLEHHSLARDEASDEDHGEQTESLTRLLTENWDAPIILTTNVQLLESMMAHRPSRCRKLHRLAKSVVLFDEVQTLPIPLATATLATLSRLADPGGPFGSSVVIATATQPAFAAFNERVEELSTQGWRPREIVSNTAQLYRPAAERVHVTWRHEEPITLEELADEVAEHRQVLCIVNLKRHATSIVQHLIDRGVDGLLHLSTNMCPAHREKTLAEVRQRLGDEKPVRLIATQCVEAGVDLSFPIVFRALAPLEAIAQAAGRCNRHGDGPRGEVIVVKPADKGRKSYPPGYGPAVSATENFLKKLAIDGDLCAIEIINDPDRLKSYFQTFYGLEGRTATDSVREDERELHEAVLQGDFAEVDKHYELISQDAINILVPYEPDTFEALQREITEAELLTPELIRRWFRKAAPHAVSIYRPQDRGDDTWAYLDPVPLTRKRELENHEATWFFALPELEYDRKTIGLCLPKDDFLIL